MIKKKSRVDSSKSIIFSIWFSLNTAILRCIMVFQQTLKNLWYLNIHIEKINTSSNIIKKTFREKQEFHAPRNKHHVICRQGQGKIMNLELQFFH